MNRLLWRLLRRHISLGQMAGFFFANLFGMVIILLGIQFYRDVAPMFSAGDSFMKGDYIIISKKISTLGSFAGKATTFSPAEVEDIEQQSFARSVGAFTATQFRVSAGISMQNTDMQMGTALFFESVPDAFVDVKLDKWQFDEATGTVPIIIPRNYLNLYNFGFAQSQNLPKISEGLLSLVQMNIVLRGNNRREELKGSIVGFSNRLNTILVPEAFTAWANDRFAPGVRPEPSRLIIEVNNPADAGIAQYFQSKGYETEDNKLDAGKTSYFLRLIVGIVLIIGVVITLLSFYLLMLSIFLLLQKNLTKLESLLLIGYSHAAVARPYQLLTVLLSSLVLLMALPLVAWMRGIYLGILSTISPASVGGSFVGTIVLGLLISVAVVIINVLVIRKKVDAIWKV